MSVVLAEIPGAFHLPKPNWEKIGAWVNQQVAEPDRAQAWKDLADQWLQALNEALGGAYRTLHGSKVILFAASDCADADELMGFAESGLAAIVDALGELSAEGWLGPLVILLFGDPESYSLYISPFNPDEESIRSGGMCLRQGYVHIALRPYPLETLRRLMLHEITHACLSHLNIPGWLEEGITQLAEEATVPKWQRFQLDGQTASDLRKFWRGHGLGDFWWGNGFFSLDEVQGNSYLLAQILFRLIKADYPRQLPDFVRHAQVADAGDSAAHQFLGKGVAELAAQFLGPGPWEPVPSGGHGWFGRGSLYYSRNQFQKAINDFTEAIRLDPRLADAFAGRGAARGKLGHYAAAIADLEQAIQVNPYHAFAHNSLAWLLATGSEKEHRDGKRALDHASRAQDLFGGDAPWYCLETLAAAYAEVGDFEEARKIAKQALRTAPPEEREGCKEQLRLYREGKPYREEVGNPL